MNTSKIIKYIAIYLLVSLGFALLMYGSNISCQWDKFNGIPFSKQLVFALFLIGVVLTATLWQQ
jgi:hypothetical protein